MNSSEKLFYDWLEHRYSFDAQARNKNLEKKLIRSLKKDSVTIVDVGSGLGANTCYYATKFPINQKWILIELDKSLHLKAYNYLIKKLCDKFNVKKLINNNLFFYNDEKNINIEFHLDNLLNTTYNLEDADLIVANAVFDLFSANQFTRFAKNINSFGIPLYPTIDKISNKK